MDLNTIFAVLIGLISLVALVVAGRAWNQGEAARQSAMGWMLFATAGVLQVLNLMTGYNLLLSIITTVGMLVGIWMSRGSLRRV